MDVNVTIKIEIGESVKNLFAEMFKLVGNKPSLVVAKKEEPAPEEATQPDPQPEKEAAKEEPKAATKARTRSASTSKKVEAPEPEPENIPEIPEDEAELTEEEASVGDPVDENGETLTPQKIQVIAMRKGLPAFKAALAEVTKGTVKTLQTLHGADMQGVYNYLLKLDDAKGK